MSESLNSDRRNFLRTAAAIFTAAQLGLASASNAMRPDESDTANFATPADSGSSFMIKQIDAGVLNVGYAEAGPIDGAPVILLHGWPYDIYSFVDVAPLLASAGYRVIV